MKRLTENQIALANSPKQRGRTKGTTPTENYQNIYEQGNTAFAIIKQITEILPNLEKYQNDYKYIPHILELFTKEKLNPILEDLFPTQEEIGASVNDSILFDPNKISGERIKLAVNLLKFCSDYLLLAFPPGQWDYLQSRIKGLVEELEGMVNTFNKTKELHEQIEAYQQHTERFEPITIKGDEHLYTVMCEYCRVYNADITLIKTIEKLNHKSLCHYLKDTTNLNPEKIQKWFKVVFPGESNRYDFIKK